MLDFHDLSFHDSAPELDSAMPELIRPTKVIREIEKLFPEMIIVGSNHGDLPLIKPFVLQDEHCPWASNLDQITEQQFC
jgi:hypothetical protein